MRQGWPLEPSGKVTKGNKKFAGSAEIREDTKGEAVARRASIYRPKRVIEANFEVVRDAGFEPATSCV